MNGIQEVARSIRVRSTRNETDGDITKRGRCVPLVVLRPASSSGSLIFPQVNLSPDLIRASIVLNIEMLQVDVHVDVNKPDKLITNGMFAISRNPIYVCFLLFFIGLLLVYRNIVVAVSIVLFALVIHRQILREEEFLAGHYGEEYDAYCKKARRYL